MNLEQLRRLQTEDVRFEDRVDINSIRIDYLLNQVERAMSHISQIKNPYVFRCGDCAINIRFAKPEKSLEEGVRSYLLAQKGNH
jgi:hypothetical protein